LSRLLQAQSTDSNKKQLDTLGGYEGLLRSLDVEKIVGLRAEQIEENRQRYGSNQFPNPPMKSWIRLFFEAFKDPTVIILLCAATVSLIVGIIEEPGHGWIEGTAIFLAIFLVATVTATNNYTKERQFRALDDSSKKDIRCSVLRAGELQRINPEDLVVGDIVVMGLGDGIPADGVLIDGSGVKSNESSLTGEPEDVRKEVEGSDPFLLSSCTITALGASANCKMVVIGVGANSQWGKIRAKLVTETVNTPLQDKLEHMAKVIGYVGTSSSVATFTALIVMIWAKHHGNDVARHVIHAFIIAITIIVVAIPEGLPLAVTISLAYSTKKMYKDQNLIRVLAACETMGNATNICSDKTGTLTENQMNVVEGWFGGQRVLQESLASEQGVNTNVRDLVAYNAALNSAAHIQYKDEKGEQLHKPKVIGSATEGALLLLSSKWGYDFDTIRREGFNPATDKQFPFNSGKKRSTAVIRLRNGVTRLYCKGASEWILKDCTKYSNSKGSSVELTQEVSDSLKVIIEEMANKALRTLCLAHRDFPTFLDLPAGWETNPPDNQDLILDAIVGIIDPLRSDVKEAVRIAQEAGVMVRMVTGDNISTAKAIARDCGILTSTGTAIEGPDFRQLTPNELDKILDNIQVMARSSPEDKFLLVTRLNGSGLPDNKEKWCEQHPGKTWEQDRDKLLPGYKQEWDANRPEGGEVVGVTGDGTNDAPALKAADVGLSMGITGTQVAKDASDIVILDDKFSSIVKAIMWGRAVYDNIRKFLQFQVTVNIVALTIVFIGSVAGFDPPLNAVMMLWVNLIMDTLGALALGTESPSRVLLERRPYKRSAFLISHPMWRNIFVSAIYQLVMLLCLLFVAPKLLDLNPGNYCTKYENASNNCKEEGDGCVCEEYDYTHFSFIFNSFVFAQVFNEINSRSITNEKNVLRGLHTNQSFLMVIFITCGLQALIIHFGARFTMTTGLDGRLWGWSILLGFINLPVSFLGRLLLPVKESEDSFAGYSNGISKTKRTK